MSFYVYTIFDLKTDTLQYVGRSHKPRDRLQKFIKRTGILARLGALRRYSNFQDACQAELATIELLQPALNRKPISSPGTHGQKMTIEARSKLSAALRGRVLSNESKARIADSLKGRKLNSGTPESYCRRWSPVIGATIGALE